MRNAGRTNSCSRLCTFAVAALPIVLRVLSSLIAAVDQGQRCWVASTAIFMKHYTLLMQHYVGMRRPNWQCLSAFLLFLTSAHAQQPVIYPGGVVSAASYTTGGATGNAIAPGSLAALFGMNLARDTLTPDPLLLSTQLGGARVTVGGIPAYLHYVSPSNIIFEMPFSVLGSTSVIVSTVGGSTPPYLVNAADAFGVFTLGDGGCGPADALLADGSLNSTSNSVSPGDFLSLYGTGLFPLSPLPSDGVPALSNPLSNYTGALGGITFDLDGPFSAHDYAGLAPGWVALNQVNVKVPETAREGCAVPLLISTGNSGNTRPVTVSIRKGGGPCVDPPVAGYGKIEWKKTIITGVEPDIELDGVTISLQASPGKRSLSERSLPRSKTPVTFRQNFGPACTVPLYRSLDAGMITVQGPVFGPAQAALRPFSPPEGSQIIGLTEYHADLPRGAIRPGLFDASATGGSDVGAFHTALRIGAGVNITTPLPAGTVLDRRLSLVVTWSGGDSDAVVTMKLVVPHGSYQQFVVAQAPASDESIAIAPAYLTEIPAGPVVIDIEVAPADLNPLVAPGLSLGGENTWKYIYRFSGLSVR